MRIIVIVILLSLTSCYSTKEKQACIDRIREKSKANELSQKVINGLRDSMIDWANKGVLRYSYLKNNLMKYDYEEIVLFTKDSNRAYSCYHMTDKDSTYIYQSIAMYYAERKEGKWIHYCEIGPVIVYFRDRNDNKSWTKEQLQKEYDKQLMKYLDVKNCRIDYPDTLINIEFRSGDLYNAKKSFWDDFYMEQQMKK